jgi:preprotein translocase subunit SecB
MVKAERLGKTNGTRAEAREADLPNSEAPAELKLLGQYIKDLSFESPHAAKLKLLESLGQTSGLQTDVDVNVTSQGENTYDPRDLLQQVLFVECPKLLFPSLRRVLADTTHNGGFPPLMLDFGRLHGLAGRQPA